jgi:hypothetical protein
MNYYLFCYYASAGVPNLTEAQEVVEQCGLGGLPGGSLSALARKLMDYNPGLLQHAINDTDLLEKQPAKEKRMPYRHILLMEKDDKADVRINIYADNVSLEVPLISSPDLADRAISSITAYVSIICDQTGYFVYDPQTGHTCDLSGPYIAGLKTFLFTRQQSINK